MIYFLENKSENNRIKQFNGKSVHFYEKEHKIYSSDGIPNCSECFLAHTDMEIRGKVIAVWQVTTKHDT